MATPRRFAALLAALDTLDDAQLQALRARTQTILLDRPNLAPADPALNVEIRDGPMRRHLAGLSADAPVGPSV